MKKLTILVTVITLLFSLSFSPAESQVTQWAKVNKQQKKFLDSYKSGPNVNYKYDAMSRITMVAYKSDSVISWIFYSWDPVGNMTSQIYYTVKRRKDTWYAPGKTNEEAQAGVQRTIDRIAKKE